MTHVREYTNKILELVDEGVIDADRLAHHLLCFMSESDVKQFYESHYLELDESYEPDFGDREVEID